MYFILGDIVVSWEMGHDLRETELVLRETEKEVLRYRWEVLELQKVFLTLWIWLFGVQLLFLFG